MNPTDRIERRYVGSKVEFRADGDARRIVGYAAKFDRDSQPLGWSGFIERIAPGAFKKTIKEADVRALFNHEPNIVLGRNKAGTLDLSEDATGLRYEIEPDMGNTQTADVVRMIERGDVSQSSFGFEVVKVEWVYPQADDEPLLRILREVKLWDVSPVTFPAYLDTEVEVKKALRGLALEVSRPVDEVFDAVAAGEFRALIGTSEPAKATPDPAVIEPTEVTRDAEARRRWLTLNARG